MHPSDSTIADFARHVIQLEQERLAVLQVLRNPHLKPRDKTLGVSLIYHLLLSEAPSADGFHRVTLTGPNGLAAETGMERQAVSDSIAWLERIGLLQSHTVTERRGGAFRKAKFLRLIPPTLLECLHLLAGYIG